MSVVSLGAAGLIALAQFEDRTYLFLPAMGLMAGMLLLGVLTFHRLIERRIRSIENLRAINRINRYYVERDPELLRFFYWPPCDDAPPFHLEKAALAGLRPVIALLNSIFTGLVIFGVLHSIQLELSTTLCMVVGALTGMVVWALHQVHEGRSLDKAEEQAQIKDVIFPVEENHEKTISTYP